MHFNDLITKNQKQPTRVGRGISAGKGKTAGRGTKGQNARTGGGVRPGFEGGQNPLAQRMPKLPGFRSIHPKAENIYTGKLDNLGPKIDNFLLAKAGIISSPYVRVKLIFKGEVAKKLEVQVQSASKSAIQAVEKNGGKVIITERLKRSPKEKTTK